jgi:geranylgeranyl diphosphate synthase type II
MNQANAVFDHEITNLVADVEQLMRQQVANSEAASYHLACGGSRVRATSCIEVSLALGLDTHSAIRLASCVELLHNASLIHDDLQDNDPTRRGHPAVWHKFGKNAAICAGDLLIAKAFGELAHIPDIRLIPCLLIHVEEAVSQTIEGQSLDIQSMKCDNLNDYEAIASAKSGPLLRLPIELPLMAAEYKHVVHITKRAISRFAIAYQIADDLCDWQADAQNEQLNIVNILALQMPRKEAINMAQMRAQQLLQSCQLDLNRLPNGSGSVFVDLTQKLLTKVMRYKYE